MFDELDRLRGSRSCSAARTLPTTRRNRPPRLAGPGTRVEGAEPRELVRLHGELLAYNWIEQNTGETAGAGAGWPPPRVTGVTTAGVPRPEATAGRGAGAGRLRRRAGGVSALLVHEQGAYASRSPSVAGNPVLARGASCGTIFRADQTPSREGTVAPCTSRTSSTTHRDHVQLRVLPAEDRRGVRGAVRATSPGCRSCSRRSSPSPTGPAARRASGRTTWSSASSARRT